MNGSVSVTRQELVATVLIDNQGKKNAIDRGMWIALGEAFEALPRDDTLRCVVLRGAGSEDFASGGDIEEFPSTRGSSESAAEYARHVHRTLRLVRECPIPTLAAIRGVCIGGGLELAVVCDLRLCSEESLFGVPIATLGATLAHAELQGLVELVGPGVTLELLLDGRLIDANEAVMKGLVGRSVKREDFDVEVDAAVKRVCRGAPRSARWHKKFLRQLMSVPRLSDADVAEGFACFDTEDYRAGVAAFLNKRRPQFTGR